MHKREFNPESYQESEESESEKPKHEADHWSAATTEQMWSRGLENCSRSMCHYVLFCAVTHSVAFLILETMFYSMQIWYKQHSDVTRLNYETKGLVLSI